jgi:hypothetical protein
MREIKKILAMRPRQPLPTLFTKLPRTSHTGNPVSEKTSSRQPGE